MCRDWKYFPLLMLDSSCIWKITNDVRKMFNPAANGRKVQKFLFPKAGRPKRSGVSLHMIMLIISYLKCRSEVQMQADAFRDTWACSTQPLPCPVSLCSSAEKQIMRRDGLIFLSSCHCWGLYTLDSHLTPAHYCKVKPNQAYVHAPILYVWSLWRFTSVHRAPYSMFVLDWAHVKELRLYARAYAQRHEWLFYL